MSDRLPGKSLNEANSELAPFGVLIAWHGGSYVVAYTKRRDLAAYTTDDLADALSKGRAMALYGAMFTEAPPRPVPLRRVSRRASIRRHNARVAARCRIKAAKEAVKRALQDDRLILTTLSDSVPAPRPE